MARTHARVPLAALLAVLLTALAGTLVAAPSAQAAARAAAAPVASQTQAMSQERITFAGRIGKAKRTVVLQRKVSTKWRTVAEKRTTASGRYRFGFNNTAATGTSPAYRVIAPAARGRAKVVSKSVRVPSIAGAFDLTLSTNYPRLGQPFTATTTLSPARPGATVTITTTSSSGGASNTFTTTLDASSRATFTAAPTAAGTQIVFIRYGAKGSSENLTNTTLSYLVYPS